MPSRYTQQHFQDLAALLAAEREQNGPSPALNRITAAITQLFAENSASFNRELFGKAARGTVPVTTRPASLRSGRPESGISLLPDVTPPPTVHDLARPGWTPPVVTPVDEADPFPELHGELATPPRVITADQARQEARRIWGQEDGS
jgi:hypothetical protein